MAKSAGLHQDLDHFSALVESIYDAAQDPQHWSTFLSGLCRALNAKSGMFRVIDESATAIRANIHYRLDPDLQEAHRNYYVNQDIFIKALRDKPGGYITSTQHMIDPREMERSEFYADYMRPQDSYHVCGGLAMRNEAFTIKFGVQRDYKSGEFSSDDADYIRRFVPHIQRATHLGHLLDMAERQTTTAEQALESLAVGIALLDEHERVVHANTRADEVLTRNLGLARRNGRFCAVGPGDNARLREIMQLIQLRARLECPPVPEAMLLTPSPGDPQLLIVVCPVPASKPHFRGPWPQVSSAVFISNLQDAGLLNHDVLMTLYGLTGAEARLACALSRGRELGELSVEWSVSRETLRTHLKRVLGKTGTSRQSELVRLLNGKPWNLLGRPQELS